MNSYIEVSGWEEFQHYKDRDPVWIKLHRTLLDNYEFSRLQDASKSHLIGIWLLAARHNNRIPLDLDWIAQRISATEPINLQLLADAGFIEIHGEPEQSASNLLALTRSREERRGEEKREDVAASPRRDSKQRARRKAPSETPSENGDRQEQQEKAPKVTWLTPMQGPWERRFGDETFDFKRAAGELKPWAPMLKKRPASEIAQSLTCYLEQTETQYASLSAWARKYGAWKPKADDEAQTMLALLKPIWHLPRGEFQAEVDHLAQCGRIPDKPLFLDRASKLDFLALRQSRDDAQALAHIRSRISANGAHS